MRKGIDPSEFRHPVEFLKVEIGDFKEEIYTPIFRNMAKVSNLSNSKAQVLVAQGISTSQTLEFTIRYFKSCQISSKSAIKYRGDFYKLVGEPVNYDDRYLVMNAEKVNP